MALDLNLPTPGQKVWGAQLNGEIEKIADAVNENSEEIDGRLSEVSLLSLATQAVYKEEHDPDEVGYDIIPIIGQSNGLGRGTPLDLVYLDGSDPRVLQFANLSSSYADSVVAAMEPLFHQELPVSTVGFPLTFAKIYAQTIPANRKVLLVPCARGNTGYFPNTAEYTWRVGVTGGVAINLYSLAVEQINKALALPGQNRVVGFLFHQGEANSSSTTTAYRNDVLATIDDLRNRYGADLPFVLGQMSPRRIFEAPGYAAIDGVHQTMKDYRPHIGFWKAQPMYNSAADVVHFSAEAQRYNGQAAFNAWQAATESAGGNVEPVLLPMPAAPTGVSVGTAGTTLTLTWLRAPRAYHYVLRYRAVGTTTWIAGPTTSDDGTTTATISGLTNGVAYEVQVAAVNNSGTGPWSSTVYSSTPWFIDTFNRPDGPVGTTTDGKTWTSFVSSGVAYPAVIVSNAVARGTGGTASRTLWVIDGTSADGVLRAKVGAVGDSTGSLVIRAQDGANYIELAHRIDATNKTYVLRKRLTTGGLSNIATTNSAVVASGDDVEVTLLGTSITVKVNGVTLFGGPQTVAELSTTVARGFLFNSSSSGAETWDSMSYQAS